jgi:hypothetical protein
VHAEANGADLRHAGKARAREAGKRDQCGRGMHTVQQGRSRPMHVACRLPGPDGVNPEEAPQANKAGKGIT